MSNWFEFEDGGLINLDMIVEVLKGNDKQITIYYDADNCESKNYNTKTQRDAQFKLLKSHVLGVEDEIKREARELQNR